MTRPKLPLHRVKTKINPAFAAAFVIVVGLLFLSFGARQSTDGQLFVEETGNLALTLASKKESSSAWKGEVVLLHNSDGTTLEMPALGFGTCCRKSAKGKAIYGSTFIYLMHGGRLIDTAMSYNNHKEIGQAIVFSEKPRADIWITSKIDPTKVKDNPREGTRKAIKKMLEELQTDYLDLVLIHSPKLKRDGTMEIWQGLIAARDQDHTVRAIGVSNFNQVEIEDITNTTGVPPQLHEIQFHPWSDPKWKAQVAWQKSQNIATTAYTSLGGSRFHAKDGRYKFPYQLSYIGEKHGATPAQVLLRWALSQGIAVIPGSSSEAHIQENLRIPSFQLTKEEMEEIENLGPPKGWWDDRRGPVKFKDAEMDLPWAGDHTTMQ